MALRKATHTILKKTHIYSSTFHNYFGRQLYKGKSDILWIKVVSAI